MNYKCIISLNIAIYGRKWEREGLKEGNVRLEDEGIPYSQIDLWIAVYTKTLTEINMYENVIALAVMRLENESASPHVSSHVS